MERGGTAPAVLNAANEVAVAAFLEGRITVPDIAALVGKTLDSADKRGLVSGASCLENILECDANARLLAQEVLAKGNLVA